MTIKELEQIVDGIRDDLMARYPQNEDAIDLTASMILYELRKAIK